MELAASLGVEPGFNIKEGLFLNRSGTYLAVLESTKFPSGRHIVSSVFDGIPVPFSSAPDWRVLAREIGRRLDRIDGV